MRTFKGISRILTALILATMLLPWGSGSLSGGHDFWLADDALWFTVMEPRTAGAERSESEAPILRGGAGPRASPLPDTHAADWRIQNVSGDGDSGALVSLADDPTWECWDTGKGPDPCRRSITSVSMVSANEGWAVGCKGLILHYVGGSWQLVNSPTTQDISAVDTVSSTEAWAVGFGGTILHYVSGTWNTFPSPTSYGLYGLDMRTPTDGWAVGCGGTILHYDGTNWQIEASPISETLYDVAMVSADEGWVVGRHTPALMLHYSDGTWSETSIPYAKYIHSLHMLSINEG